jgi:mono/diheme cytochrome c family protein
MKWITEPMKRAVASARKIRARRFSFLRCSGVLRFAMAGRYGGRGHCRDARGTPQPRLGPACVALLALVAALSGCSKPDAPHLGADADLPGRTLDGAALYDQRCGRCHGPGGTGTDQGPSLLDPFYGTAHHADAAFQRAIREGVRGYHTHIGDMPRIGGLTDAEATAIIGYVRDRQRASGIR